MIFKELFLATIAFLIGYSMGKSDETEIGNLIEEFTIKAKAAKEDVANLMFTVLDKIDEIKSDELKANLQKGADKLKERFSEFIEIKK